MPDYRLQSVGRDQNLPEGYDPFEIQLLDLTAILPVNSILLPGTGGTRSAWRAVLLGNKLLYSHCQTAVSTARRVFIQLHYPDLTTWGVFRVGYPAV
jgi:hypothetical protein